MQITKPTIDSAVAGIVKAAKQLEAVIASADKDAKHAEMAVILHTEKKTAAEFTKDRAARIKAKLEDLVS